MQPSEGRLIPDDNRLEPVIRKDGSTTLPRRGYSWPTATEGNQIALKHGANSDRVLEAKAAEARAHLIQVAPWCDRPEFAPALARFLRAEARELLLHSHVEATVAQHGAGAVPAKVWEQVTAAANSAAKLSGLLGLDPTSFARLRATVEAADVTQATLQDVIEAGKRTKAGRERQAALSADENPGDGDGES